MAPANFHAISPNFGPFLLPWTTDASQVIHTQGTAPLFRPTYGPDGPWQAVVVGVGQLSDASSASRHGPALQPLYPCGSSITQVLGKELGGTYSIHDSETAVPLHDAAANVDDWFASVMLNESTYGADAYDGIQLSESSPSTLRSQRSFAAVSTIFAASEQFDISLPSGKRYQNNVGVLGLGRSEDGRPGRGRDAPNSMMQQMMDDGMISSASFGLHIGSVSQGISGSLALGGYDIARALGPVGSFWYQQGTPFTALRDINFGVEVGDSPFDSDDLKHLYLGNNGSKIAETIRENFGAPKGSTMVIPNPATPYISLPYGNCENIAKRLPVIWQDDIGFYTWNESSPQFAKIVNSPAWMQFVLGGPDGNDLTIKVPFKLLNLTLEPPIVPKPTPYFPCRPWNSGYGFYALGRAFLQGAFIGVHYNTNKIWLAQAPGPDMLESRLVSIEPGETTIRTTSLDNFAQSWARHWTALATDEPVPAIQPSLTIFGNLNFIFVGGIVMLATVLLLGLRWRSPRAVPYRFDWQLERKKDYTLMYGDTAERYVHALGQACE